MKKLAVSTATPATASPRPRGSSRSNSRASTRARVNHPIAAAPDARRKLMSTATKIVAIIPIVGIRTNPARATPVVAPNVFAA